MLHLLSDVQLDEQQRSLWSRFFLTQERLEGMDAYRLRVKEGKAASNKKRLEEKRKREALGGDVDDRGGKKRKVEKESPTTPSSLSSSSIPSSILSSSSSIPSSILSSSSSIPSSILSSSSSIPSSSNLPSSSLVDMQQDDPILSHTIITQEQFPDTPEDLSLIRMKGIWKGEEETFAFIQKNAKELLDAKAGQWKPIMGGFMKNVELHMKALIIRVQLAVAKLQGLNNPGFSPITLIKLLVDQVFFHF
jgi:hypothetical protein